MYLNYKNIVIRNALPPDAPILAAWWNDGAVMAHAGFPDGIGTTAEEVARSLDRDSEEHRRLILEMDGIPVGEMNYRRTDDAEPVYEIGIKLCDETKQNRGDGRRYLTMLIGELFSRGAVRIVLDTNAHNLRARHVYESLGFVCTGVREHAFRDQRGNLQTAVDYALDDSRFCPFS